MNNLNAGLTIDESSGSARYNGIPLKPNQPFPGSRVRADRKPNTKITVFGRDLAYIEARLRTLQRPWEWVCYYKKTDLSQPRHCAILITAEDFGFDASELGEVSKSLCAKDYTAEKGIFFYNFDVAVKREKTYEMSKDYFRLDSSSSITVDQALSSSCSCKANTRTTLEFPGHFTKKDREFGYQISHASRYRKRMIILLESVLKPHLQDDTFRKRVLHLSSTHMAHKVYDIPRNKISDVVRKCARFFQVFYPTLTDKDHFSKVVDDFYIPAAPMNPVNSTNNTNNTNNNNHNNASNDPYKQLEAAMEAIARLQLQDMLARDFRGPPKKQAVEAVLKDRMNILLDAWLKPAMATAMSDEIGEYVQERSHR